MDGEKMVKLSPNRICDGTIVRRSGAGPELEGLLEAITDLARTNFTGYLKINFSQGGLGRIEKCEEILKRRKP